MLDPPEWSHGLTIVERCSLTLRFWGDRFSRSPKASVDTVNSFNLRLKRREKWLHGAKAQPFGPAIRFDTALLGDGLGKFGG